MFPDSLHLVDPRRCHLLHAAWIPADDVPDHLEHGLDHVDGALEEIDDRVVRALEKTHEEASDVLGAIDDGVDGPLRRVPRLREWFARNPDRGAGDDLGALVDLQGAALVLAAKCAILEAEVDVVELHAGAIAVREAERLHVEP